MLNKVHLKVDPDWDDRELDVETYMTIVESFMEATFRTGDLTMLMHLVAMVRYLSVTEEAEELLMQYYIESKEVIIVPENAPEEFSDAIH